MINIIGGEDMKSSQKKVNQEQVNSDYQWLMMQSLSKYNGQWIAVSEKNIVARDDSLKNVQAKVNSLKLKNIPFYLRVPAGSVTV